MFYLYILKSIKHGTFYVGTSCNVNNRFNLHNKGKVRSTKFKRPWQFVGSKGFLTLSEARNIESKLKSLKKRSEIEKFIKHF